MNEYDALDNVALQSKGVHQYTASIEECNMIESLYKGGRNYVSFNYVLNYPPFLRVTTRLEYSVIEIL